MGRHLTSRLALMLLLGVSCSSGNEADEPASEREADAPPQSGEPTAFGAGAAAAASAMPGAQPSGTATPGVAAPATPEVVVGDLDFPGRFAIDSGFIYIANRTSYKNTGEPDEMLKVPIADPTTASVLFRSSSIETFAVAGDSIWIANYDGSDYVAFNKSDGSEFERTAAEQRLANGVFRDGEAFEQSGRSFLRTARRTEA